MYQSFIYRFTSEEIRKILRNNGYTVKSMTKVLDYIPELCYNKFLKFTYFKEEESLDPELISSLSKSSPPSCFYNTWFAWKTPEEFEELKLALYNCSINWLTYCIRRLGCSWKYDGTNNVYFFSLTRTVLFRYFRKELMKFEICTIFDNMIQESINKLSR